MEGAESSSPAFSAWFWLEWYSMVFFARRSHINITQRHWPHTEDCDWDILDMVLSTLVIYAWCTSYELLVCSLRMAHFSNEICSIRCFYFSAWVAALTLMWRTFKFFQNTDINHISIQWNLLNRNNVCCFPSSIRRKKKNERQKK